MPTFGVRDAVEHLLRLLSVLDLSCNRVRRDGLVLRVPPLLGVVENGFRLAVEQYVRQVLHPQRLFNVHEAEKRKALRERLVEPKVSPPLHCHQVSKPHVAELAL